MVPTLIVISVVLTGLGAGTLTVGLVAVRPAMHSLSPTSYVTVKQAFDISYPRLMRPLQLGSLLATIGLTAAAGATGATACATFAGLAAACVLINILVTVRGDLPINNAMATWRPDDPPADWLQHRARWDQFNTIRTAAAVCGLVLLALAATTSY